MVSLNGGNGEADYIVPAVQVVGAVAGVPYSCLGLLTRGWAHRSLTFQGIVVSPGARRRRLGARDVAAKISDISGKEKVVD